MNICSEKEKEFKNICSCKNKESDPHLQCKKGKVIEKNICSAKEIRIWKKNCISEASKPLKSIKVRRRDDVLLHCEKICKIGQSRL